MVKLMKTIIYLFKSIFSVLYQAQYPITNGLVHSYAGSYFPYVYVHTGYNAPAYIPTISNQQQTDKLGVW